MSLVIRLVNPVRVVMFILALAGRSPASEVVRIVSASEMDWPEGRMSIEMELQASGYTLRRVPSEAVEPGLLLEQLRGSPPLGVVASVTVVRMGRSGIAYVWLPEADGIYRVTSSDPDPSRAANVLSLRVVELVSLRGTGHEVERPSPSEESAPLRLKERSEESEWLVLAGVGPRFGSGLATPLANVHVGIARNIGAAFVVEASANFSIARARQSFEQGTIRVGEQGGSLGAFLRGGESPWWHLGPAVGYRCFDVNSMARGASAETSRRACGGSLGALARVGVRWDQFSVWFAGLASVGVPAIQLLDGTEVIATLDRPFGFLSAGGSWHF